MVDHMQPCSVSRSRNRLRDHQPEPDDHTARGVGGRQYGTSEDIETLQGQNNTSATRLGAVEKCGSSLARRGQFARIIGTVLEKRLAEGIEDIREGRVHGPFRSVQALVCSLHRAKKPKAS